MQRRWWVLTATTLIFFFLNAATFTSLGVVLYSMVADLHWSQTAAGFSFSVLGIACGISSPLPAVLMKRIGPRWTIVMGCAMLAVGFLLASVAQGLLSFYAAMILLGIGFSLGGNVPGVYVVASWFSGASARMIGLYMMGGACGSVVGPPLVQAILSSSGSWRMHWPIMAVVAVVIGVVCLICIRDLRRTEPAVRSDGSPAVRAENGWTSREALLTPQFLLVAASMALTMACVTTINSVAVTHLVQLGSTPAAAAVVLSTMALVVMLAKGIAGRICELVRTRGVLAAGMALQAVGVILFAVADSPLRTYAFSFAFGIGWGAAYVAASVLLLEYFGREIGSQLLAMVWLLSTAAAAGPVVAGVIADHANTFAPVFYLYAGLLGLVTLPIAIMRSPQLPQPSEQMAA